VDIFQGVDQQRHPFQILLVGWSGLIGPVIINAHAAALRYGRVLPILQIQHRLAVGSTAGIARWQLPGIYPAGFGDAYNILVEIHARAGVAKT